MSTKCKLCNKDTKLCHSHYIPKFITNWKKDTGPTGNLRISNKINQSQQDGIKEYLFCKECEKLFSKYEKYFAEHIFHKLHSMPPSNIDELNIDYDYISRFAVSISLRCILLNFKAKKITDDKVNSCIEIYKSFLLDKKKNTNKNIQYIGILPDGYNEPKSFYPFMRALIMDFWTWPPSNTAITFTKLGRIIILGIVYNEHINFNNTKILSESLQALENIPTEIDIMLSSTQKKFAGGCASISDEQKKNTEKKMLNNKDKVRNSNEYKMHEIRKHIFGKW